MFNLYADVDGVIDLAETPGVTHFGAYHRPPDGNFFNIIKRLLQSHIPPIVHNSRSLVISRKEDNPFDTSRKYMLKLL